MARIIYGSYIGDGDKWSDPRVISFNHMNIAYFAVVYVLNNGQRSDPFFIARNLSYWVPAGVVNVSYYGNITNSSFEVGADGYGNVGLNMDGKTYNYIIFGI